MLVEIVQKTIRRIKELERMLEVTTDPQKKNRIIAELKIQKNSLEAYRVASNDLRLR